MPSSEVAKYCRTVRPAESKNAGAVLITSKWPSVVPYNNRDGVRNPLESRKISSPVWSAVTIAVLLLGSRPRAGVRVQVRGVTMSTRLATSVRVTITSRSRVQAYWCRQVCSSGSNTVANSAVPSMNCS